MLASARMGRKRRILLISRDVVGSRMAGPGMRYTELARRLAAVHDIVLLAPGAELGEREGMRQYPLCRRRLARYSRWAEILISQGFAYPMATVLGGKKIQVFDLYDPQGLELAALYGPLRGRRQQAYTRLRTRLLLRRADLVLCANSRQRRFWLGALYAEGRIRDAAGSTAPVVVVPNGIEALPRTPLPETWTSLYGKPGTPDANQVLVWGGGLWDWLDPRSAVAAVADLSPRYPRLRLLFIGTRHPNPELPDFPAVEATRELARQRGVLGNQVVFVEDWTPHAERGALLVHAFAGISLHHKSLESEFAFRTRILDYLAAGIPIVASRGDELGDLVAERQLGASVAPGDHAGLVAGLDRLLGENAVAARARANVEAACQERTWDRALAPLFEFCETAEIPHRSLAGRWADAGVYVAGLARVALDAAARLDSPRGRGSRGNRSDPGKS